jgi:hypothetical protein
MNSPGTLLIKEKDGRWAYDEQLALCAAESEHARTQGGGEGGDWDHAPTMDREAIVKLRQRVSRRTMVRTILRKNG